MKYNELQQTHGDTATDSDDNNGVFEFSRSSHFHQLHAQFNVLYFKLSFWYFFRWDSVTKGFLLSRLSEPSFMLLRAHLPPPFTTEGLMSDLLLQRTVSSSQSELLHYKVFHKAGAEETYH